MAQMAVLLVPPPQVQNPFPPCPAGAQPRSPAPAVPGFAAARAEYQKLKELDSALDSAHDSLSHAQDLYQATFKKFAVLCHELWEREKAQGNHQGKGFRQKLLAVGIKAGRAYRAMQKFFPSDFTAKRKSLKKRKFSTLSAADKVVGLRFTAKLPQGKDALECIFALTPEEKAECTESLKLVDPAQVQQLFLQALKQAAYQAVRRHDQSEIVNQKSEIINNDTVCNGIAPNGAPVPHELVAGSQKLEAQKSEIKNQKSEIPNGLAAK